MMIKQALTAFGLGASLPLILGVSGMAPVPDGVWWVPYAMSFALGIIASAAHLAGRIYTARKRARAQLQDAEGDELLADGKPENDARGRALKAAARLDLAEVDAIEKELSKRDPKP